MIIAPLTQRVGMFLFDPKKIMIFLIDKMTNNR